MGHTDHSQVRRTIVLPNSSISTVGERAAATVAQASHVVLIAAEILGLCLGLEAAVPVVDYLRVKTREVPRDRMGRPQSAVRTDVQAAQHYLPNDLVVLHACKRDTDTTGVVAKEKKKL
jgi:hypothetical protein